LYPDFSHSHITLSVKRFLVVAFWHFRVAERLEYMKSNATLVTGRKMISSSGSRHGSHQNARRKS
jgi:hypothetical protein